VEKIATEGPEAKKKNREKGEKRGKGERERRERKKKKKTEAGEIEENQCGRKWVRINEKT